MPIDLRKKTSLCFDYRKQQMIAEAERKTRKARALSGICFYFSR